MKKFALVTASLAALLAAQPASAAIYNYQTSFDGEIGTTNVTIDTVAGTANFRGRNINLTMTGASIRNFNPNLGSYGTTYKVDSISGWLTRERKFLFGTRWTETVNAFWSSWPKHTQFRLGNDSSFLWLYGRNGNNMPRDIDAKGTWTSYTGSTSGSSTSGSSTSGSSTSSGGSSGGSNCHWARRLRGECGSSSSSSSTSSGGSTTSGGTSTSGGSTTTSGGTPVPAPGMLGLFGMAILALGFGRRRRFKKRKK